jgi:hypothetical protein
LLKNTPKFLQKFLEVLLCLAKTKVKRKEQETKDESGETSSVWPGLVEPTVNFGPAFQA